MQMRGIVKEGSVFRFIGPGLRYPRSYNRNKSLANAETKGVGSSRNLLRAHMQRI